MGWLSLVVTVHGVDKLFWLNCHSKQPLLQQTEVKLQGKEQLFRQYILKLSLSPIITKQQVRRAWEEDKIPLHKTKFSYVVNSLCLYSYYYLSAF